MTKQAPFKTRQTDHLISMPNVNFQMLVPSPSGILQHKNKHVSRLATFGSSVKLKPPYLTLSNGVENHSLTDSSFILHWQNKAVTDNIKPIIATC